MRLLAAIIASLCVMGLAAPADAIEELKSCSDLKDEPARLACMQDHIAHLEETILRLDGQLVDLGREMQKRVAVESVYKLQSVEGKCLGSSDDDRPVLQSCDNPDSWKLFLGSQTKKKADVAKDDAPQGDTSKGGSGKGKKSKPDTGGGGAATQATPGSSMAKTGAPTAAQPDAAKPEVAKPAAPAQ
jgi:hypothetical protein